MSKDGYRLTVKISFSAAHFLREYAGKCSNLHGHTWIAECSVEGSKLNSLGMLIDFHDLEDLVKEVTDEFDHSLINDHPSFSEEGLNPTAENLAWYIYHELEKKVDRSIYDIMVKEITLWESQDAYATYKRKE
ncbi:MAG: 6-carboxytetrahydropterin synthase QueD [Candidatus Syntrophonatronum acetioxidans]|uniref:6-carboxy-5,6,7,8-tetrahydropterin synthase n=1 Tax=Candidatus Syntrophonatronum acetioxidans TaxID=1795816 RepID=A0A424YFH3_9FIRM|nr:MAG: 6-carboxytetrahydropterin synthase QueD [Candidatus Syntrophonatronum acetioxidans]